MTKQVEELHDQHDERVTEDLLWLARGPSMTVNRYKKYIINGIRFRTLSSENNKTTQNSGVVVTAKTSSFSTVKDNNPLSGDVTYFGRLNDIIELNYHKGKKIVLFNCDWVDVNTRRGIKTDELGFTLVNFNHLLRTKETFVLASQAQQCFYSEDPIDKDWNVVIVTKPRDTYDMNNDMEEDGFEFVDDAPIEHETHNDQQLEAIEIETNVNWDRPDVPDVIIDTPLTSIGNNDACEDTVELNDSGEEDDGYEDEYEGDDDNWA